MKPEVNSQPDSLLTKKQVAGRLGLSLRSVERLVAKGALERVKILGAVRYRDSQVRMIILGGAA